MNWFPLGLAYAFMYMGRYNITVAKVALGDVMTKKDFGFIFGLGCLTYCVTLLFFNGAMVDRYGGRKGMLLGLAGAMVANAGMGLVLYGQSQLGWDLPLVGVLTLLYCINMYFQSFGAVCVIKVKTPWFRVSERGGFSTAFGVVIALGFYFAFDWGKAIVEATRAELPLELSSSATVLAALFRLVPTGVDQNWMVFWVPAICMAPIWLVLWLVLRDRPSDAGFADFDTGEESLSGTVLPLFATIRKVLLHPVLFAIVIAEFCSGVLRNGIMHWYLFFAEQVGFADNLWISRNWGLALFLCAAIGANVTGWVSDRVFQSRRAPMAAFSYAMMTTGCAVLLTSFFGEPWIGAIASMTIISGVVAVHGILAGTQTADFGGQHNVGKVVGVVNGVVYLGSFFQSWVVGYLVPGEGPEAADPKNWILWPLFLLPFAVLGLIVTLRMWHAVPRKNRSTPL